VLQYALRDGILRRDVFAITYITMNQEETQKTEETKVEETPTATLSTPATTAPSAGDSVKINKRMLYSIAGIIVLGLGVFGAMHTMIAATVNGMPVMRLSIMRGLEAASGDQFLDQMISERVIHSAARAANIVVIDADIEAEIARIETGLAAQGATMDALLAQEGLTREALKKQMVMRKKVELLLGEKVAVTSEEVDKYIADARLTIDPAQAEEMRSAITEQIKSQKLQQEAPAFVEELRASANIRYYGRYEEAVK
jgi:parvulin-like peptidyl-prolyl isomerase